MKIFIKMLYRLEILCFFCFFNVLYGQKNALNPYQIIDSPNKKWGLVDKFGRDVTPPKYDDIQDYFGGYAAVNNGGKRNDEGGFLGGTWGFIDSIGKEICPIQYENVGKFLSDHASVKKNGKWGIIDNTGKEIISPTYDSTDVLSRRFGAVRQSGKWQIVEYSTQSPQAELYDEILNGYGFNNYISFSKSGKWGCLNSQNGKEVLAAQFDEISIWLKNGKIKVRRGTFWGMLDKNGKEVLPIQYDAIEELEIGCYAVTVKGKIGILNFQGKELIRPQFDELTSYGFEYAPDSATVAFAAGTFQGFRIGDKWGVFIKSGKVIAAPKYEEIGYGLGGLLPIKSNGKWGLLDKVGKEILPPTYAEFYGLSGSPGKDIFVVANQQRKQGLINAQGKELLPCKYDQISHLYKEYFQVSSDESESGHTIIGKGFKPDIVPFETIIEFNGNNVKAKKTNKWGLIGRIGEEIAPFVYDEIKNGNNSRSFWGTIGNKIVYVRLEDGM